MCALSSARRSYTPTLIRLLSHAYSHTPTLTRLLLHAYSYTPALTRLGARPLICTSYSDFREERALLRSQAYPALYALCAGVCVCV